MDRASGMAALTAAVERWLAGEQHALPAVAAAVRALDVARTTGLAAGLRAGRGGFGVRWSTLPVEQARAACLAGGVELAGLCSMHRNGRVREVALGVLVATRASLAVRFLVLRLDDVVEPLRARAQEALARLIDRDGAPPRELGDALVRALPLVAQMARRRRAGASTVLRELAAFLVDPAHGWTALVAANRDRDPAVRAAAYQLAVRNARSSLAELLDRALADADPSIVRWAAIEVTSSRVARPVQDALIDRLDASRDPEIRRRALLARARRGDPPELLERALVDPRSTVRFTAREKLPGRTLARCLAALADPHTPRDLQLGALGGIAECGDPSHAPLALARLADRDAGIRAEAVRCLRMLAPDVHRAALIAASGDPSARVRREAARGLRAFASSA